MVSGRPFTVIDRPTIAGSLPYRFFHSNAAMIPTRSAFLVLREAFYGTTRFDEFAERVGISEPVTATRLRELVENGLLELEPGLHVLGTGQAVGDDRRLEGDDRLSAADGSCDRVGKNDSAPCRPHRRTLPNPSASELEWRGA